MPRDKQTLLNPPLYNEDAIQPLEGLEAVRKRPGMYVGALDEELGTQNTLHHGLSLLSAFSRPLRDATVTITREHSHQLSLHAPMTNTIRDHHIPMWLTSLHNNSPDSPGLLNAFCDVFTFRILQPDQTRWWCYERGEQTMVLSSPGVDGPPCVQIDADLDRDLLTTGISWSGLQQLAWREAALMPGLRFILRDTPSGDEVAICAPDGPASYLRTLTATPILSIARTTGEARIQLAIARVPEERSHIALWTNHDHYTTRSGPLLAAVKAAVAGSTHRSRAQHAIKPLPRIAILFALHHRPWGASGWSYLRRDGQRREHLLNTASIEPLLASLKVALPQWRLHR
jgi:hypothetical protein